MTTCLRTMNIMSSEYYVKFLEQFAGYHLSVQFWVFQQKKEKKALFLNSLIQTSLEHFYGLHKIADTQ